MGKMNRRAQAEREAEVWRARYAAAMKAKHEHEEKYGPIRSVEVASGD
jgi:hypothetical protein